MKIARVHLITVDQILLMSLDIIYLATFCRRQCHAVFTCHFKLSVCTPFNSVIVEIMFEWYEFPVIYSVHLVSD